MSAKFPRRQFLQTAAAGSLLATRIEADVPPVQSSASPSDRIRFGIIGVGMQGSGLLGSAITLPGVECAAAADLWDGRHTLAREITNNPNLPTTRRYQELLDRKDIDCIIAAVPDHWHRRVVVDCCKAGKDVYCEKPMSHTIEDGFAMVDAAHANKRVVQIGSQRVSSALCAKARELYHDGVIGNVEFVELTMGRNDPNGAWVYPPPPVTPETLDWNTWLNEAPKIPLDAVRFARWRCWREYGTGVGGDLMVHLLSGMLYTLDWNEPPQSAAALGGIFRFHDGRDMPDVHLVVFDYHGVPVYVRLDLCSASPETARFYGPKGVLEATGGELRYLPQSGQDTAPSYYSGGFPAKVREQYVKQWHAEHPVPPDKQSLRQPLVFQSDNWDELRPHLWNFFQAVKTRGAVTEDAVFGNHAAIACHMANQSYFRKGPVYWDGTKKNIRA